jgi:hypothetical protein
MATKTKTDRGKVLRCARGFKFVKKGKHRVELRKKGGGGGGGPIITATCQCSKTSTGCSLIFNDEFCFCKGMCGTENCRWVVKVVGLTGSSVFIG